MSLEARLKLHRLPGESLACITDRVEKGRVPLEKLLGSAVAIEAVLHLGNGVMCSREMAVWAHLVPGPSENRLLPVPQFMARQVDLINGGPVYQHLQLPVAHTEPSCSLFHLIFTLTSGEELAKCRLCSDEEVKTQNG